MTTLFGLDAAALRWLSEHRLPRQGNAGTSPPVSAELFLFPEIGSAARPLGRVASHDCKLIRLSDLSQDLVAVLRVGGLPSAVDDSAFGQDNQDSSWLHRRVAPTGLILMLLSPPSVQIAS